MVENFRHSECETMEYFKYNLFFGNESVLWERRGKNRSGEGVSRLVGRESGGGGVLLET